MKPRVFLSHSKADRDFIEQLANDLRTARIDAWVDEWEIPPGHSFRRKIFEEGILSCDLFFVYLTPHSASSYWVQRELDAAFVRDAEARGGFLSLFVDRDATRRSLSLERQGLHSPEMNVEVYERPLRQLIAQSWEARQRVAMQEVREQAQLEVLKLQKALAELETKIVRLESAGAADKAAVLQRLAAVHFSIQGSGGYTLAELFPKLAPAIASGATNYRLAQVLLEVFGKKEVGYGKLYEATGYNIFDFVGPLVIARLVTIVPPHGDWDELLYLTELGVALANEV
jgi:hypothetical protein